MQVGCQRLWRTYGLRVRQGSGTRGSVFSHAPYRCRPWYVQSPPDWHGWAMKAHLRLRRLSVCRCEGAYMCLCVQMYYAWGWSVLNVLFIDKKMKNRGWKLRETMEVELYNVRRWKSSLLELCIILLHLIWAIIRISIGIANRKQNCNSKPF